MNTRSVVSRYLARPGIGLLLALAVFTLAMHSVYRAHAKSPEPTRPTLAEGDPRPWTRSPGTVVTTTDTGDVTLTAALDRQAVMHRGDGLVQLEVRLRTAAMPSDAAAMPSDVVVIVDRSGSMSGDKILYAKEALRELIGRLTPRDRFGLVVYDSLAEQRIGLEHADDAARLRWLREIDRLVTGSSTNMSAGLDVGSEVIEVGRRPGRAARVLLLSDGLANAGDASLDGLVRRARRAVHGDYVLSTMGIGSDFDERIMTSLATAGAGGFYYLARLASLPGFFDAELKTARQTYAEAAELHFDAGPGVEVVSVMGMPFDRRGSDVVAPLGSLYSGHDRTLWLTLRVPAGNLGVQRVGSVSLHYRKGGVMRRLASHDLPAVDCVGDFAAYKSRIAEDVWQRALVQNELTTVRERFGDAIRSGNKTELDQAVKDAEQHRAVASALGNRAVLGELDRLRVEATKAEAAQSAPAPMRNDEAKRQKASGYHQRNREQYLHADPMSSY